MHGTWSSISCHQQMLLLTATSNEGLQLATVWQYYCVYNM